MAKRIEQPGRHGYDDLPRAEPVLAVSESPVPVDEPDEPRRVPPTLTLVGGTDFRPAPVDPLAPRT